MVNIMDNTVSLFLLYYFQLLTDFKITLNFNNSKDI